MIADRAARMVLSLNMLGLAWLSGPWTKWGRGRLRWRPLCRSWQGWSLLGWICTGWSLLGWSWALSSCSATDGPLLSARGAAGAPPSGGAGSGDVDPIAPPAQAGAPSSSPGTSPIAPGMSFQYQLAGGLDLDVEADLFIVDLFQTSAEQIAEIHARNALAVAYLSAGTLEAYRDDAELFPEEAIGNPFVAYPDESWLDPRHPEVRSLMALRLDRAKTKGFDGVLPTNLNVYRVDSGFELTADDQLDYTRWLAAAARTRSLTVGMSGDYRQVDDLVQAFDWAIHFECIRRSDCASLAPFQELNLAVFDIEYEGEMASICQEAERLDIVAILKHRSVDAFREACP